MSASYTAILFSTDNEPINYPVIIFFSENYMYNN